MDKRLAADSMPHGGNFLNDTHAKVEISLNINCHLAAYILNLQVHR